MEGFSQPVEVSPTTGWGWGVDLTNSGNQIVKTWPGEGGASYARVEVFSNETNSQLNLAKLVNQLGNTHTLPRPTDLPLLAP